MHSSGRQSTLTRSARASSMAEMMCVRLPSQSSGVWFRVAAATRSSFMAPVKVAAPRPGSLQIAAAAERSCALALSVEVRRGADRRAIGSRPEVLARAQAGVAIIQAEEAAAAPIIEALERGD